MLFVFLSFCIRSYAQYGIHYDEKHLASLQFKQKQPNGFRADLSLVAMFSSGVEDRNGLRWGLGLNLSQTVNNWTFSVGTDIYQAEEKFGLGISYAGVKYLNNEYGAAYYLTHYYQKEEQTSGLISLFLDDFQIRFEDDLLSYPFVGFKIYDRYRSAALEVRYKGFMIGSNIYTSDINGVIDVSSQNAKGIFKTGKQISSPWYAGYSKNDLLIRLGKNDSVGGFIGQNFWHRYIFQTPDFHSGDYNNPFFQLGVDKPYTLY